MALNRRQPAYKAPPTPHRANQVFLDEERLVTVLENPVGMTDTS